VHQIGRFPKDIIFTLQSFRCYLLQGFIVSSSFIPAIITFMPIEAQLRAMHKPIPEDALTITATFSSCKRIWHWLRSARKEVREQ